MLNLFDGFGPHAVLHVAALLAGLATFVGVIVFIACPRCSWMEWIGERQDDD